jgi:hypothetical protein
MSEMAMSGAPVKRFREGWALLGWGKVHYWRRVEIGIVLSLCGLSSMVGWLMEPGTFPLCKRCEKAANRRADHG